MNKNQLVLFQNVLEQMEEILQENLNSYVKEHKYDSARYCVVGLEHVGTLIDNIDIDYVPEKLIDLGFDEIMWIANDFLLALNTEDGTEYATEMFEKYNNCICSDEDVEALIVELKNV